MCVGRRRVPSAISSRGSQRRAEAAEACRGAVLHRQRSGFRGIESSTAIPLCQPERKFGIAKLPSHNVLEGQIQWPRARGAETGRRTRPSAGRVAQSKPGAPRQIDVQRSNISWVGIFFNFSSKELQTRPAFAKVPATKALGGSGSCRSQGRESHANQTATQKSALWKAQPQPGRATECLGAEQTERECPGVATSQPYVRRAACRAPTNVNVRRTRVAPNRLTGPSA